MRQSFRLRSVAVLVCLTLLGTVATIVQGAPPSAESAERPVAGKPLDINRATVSGLTAIPGIGKVTAARIVAWREQNGPFRRVEDLMKVKGIGEKSLARIRPYVTVSKGK